MAFFLAPICSLQAPLQKPEYLFASDGNESLALTEALFEVMTVSELGKTDCLELVTERVSCELRDGPELAVDRAS